MERQSQTTTLTQPVISEEVAVEIMGERRKQVGLFGGTFNPVHNGHLIMAESVRTQLALETVLFMPDNLPPHVDHKAAISGKDRLAMLELAIHDNPHFGLELCELQRGGVSYSYDTIVGLKKLHPDVDYYFIIGADMVNYLPKWYRIDDLVKLVTFVGVKRPGVTPQSPYPVLWVDAPLIDISSTQIRQRVAMGQSIRYLVPEPVRDYIQKEGLYRDDN